MENEIICKKCKATRDDVIGIEDPELYDGISYWACPKCKKIYHRWTGEELTKKEIIANKLEDFFVNM